MQFSNWIKWNNRNTLANIEYPGVYIIAISTEDLTGKSFRWIEDISYVGMTNSKGGLRNRLQQFENTISGKEGHGGAKRFRFKYPNYAKLNRLLYVAVKPFICDVTSNKVKDLKIMGKVVKHEYDCIAEYVRKIHRLPEFNDKKRSPKK
jgi:hypothetical protein